MRSLQPQVKAIQERYAGDQVIIFYISICFSLANILICYSIIYARLLHSFLCLTAAYILTLDSLMLYCTAVRVNLTVILLPTVEISYTVN
jgi:hypothetical protein